MRNVTDWRWWVVVVSLTSGMLGVLAVGFFLGQLGMSSERSEWQAERAAYIKRFPEVRAETRQACVKEYEGKLADFADLKAQMQMTNDLAAYTLRFLGDRAKIADHNTAVVLKQSKIATAAAVDAKQTAEQVDRNVIVAGAKADEAASAKKAIDKKLEKASTPAPSTSWFGSHHH